MELLEREKFLDELEALVSECVDGQGRTVLVSGEAGIGKTSLVQQFTGRETRARTLSGSCDALFTPRPLGPLHDIASQLGGTLRKLLDREAPRPLVFSAFLDELTTCNTSTIVVFEDVHWADEATLDLIKFLGRRIRPIPALLILTFRGEEVGPLHPLRTVIGDLPKSAVTRLELAPLSEAAVLNMEQQAGRSLKNLYKITGGNPFFVTEVLTSKGDGVPATVLDAVLGRVAKLQPPTRDLVELASIVPPRIEEWLLREILAPTDESLQSCVDGGLLIYERGMLRFRHELARQAVENSLSPTKSVQLHGRVLRVLLNKDIGQVTLPRIVHHAAHANNNDAVLQFAPQAGQRAAAMGAHKEAAAHFATALRFAVTLPPAERASLFEAHADECHIISQFAEAIASRESAIALRQQLGDRLREGENLSHLAHSFVVQGRTTEARQANDRAITLLRTLDPGPQLATSYRYRAYLLMGDRDNEEAIRWGRKALELAERFPDNETLTHAHNAIGSALILSGSEDEGRMHLERSLDLALTGGLDSLAAAAYGNLGSAFGEVYRFPLAEHYLATGIAYCAERDIDGTQYYMTAWLALACLYMGRWTEATDMALSVVDHSFSSVISRIMALVALGRVRARRGDPGVSEVLDEALMLAMQTGTLQRLAPVRAARAEAAWLAGDNKKALEEAGAAYELALQKRHAWFVGELTYRQRQAGRMIRVPDVAAKPFTLLAAGKWADAANEWKMRSCPYEQAMALAEGDEAAKRTALTILEQLGAGQASAVLRRRLRDEGVRSIPRGPRPTTKGNPAGLTAREVEILALLSENLQNAEIASRLFISPKTVGHHISAILSKLNVRSRGEAAAAAPRLLSK